MITGFSDIEKDKEMDTQDTPITFDQECANSYDKKRERMAPLKDALHLCMRMVLSELPADAHVLCVGVGTGAELMYLARAFPEWKFTVVEPAAAMLQACRNQAKELGIFSRCVFHEGYLDTLPPSGAFDAATSILVSHFFMQQEKRSAFFNEIAARLRPGGFLVNADLASDISSQSSKSLFEVWIRMLKYSDFSSDEVEKFRRTFGKEVAVLPPQEVESLIATGEFERPVLFSQTLFIHAWYARKTTD
ncbi:MAG: class I SAM-dependent methyltransferase [Rhizobiaceae bacterium]